MKSKIIAIAALGFLTLELFELYIHSKMIF